MPNQLIILKMSNKKANANKDKATKKEVAPVAAIENNDETPQGEATETTEATPAAEAKPAKAKKEKEVKEKKITVLSEKQKIKLAAPTAVFSRKDASIKSSLMRQDSEVIIQKLADVGPTGTNMVSLKKENSKRIFYTPEENLTSQGVVFQDVQPKAEATLAPAEVVAVIENAPVAEAAPAIENLATAPML